MELIQSWLTTIARYNFSIYEQRILIHAVNYAQERFRGLILRDNLRPLAHPFMDAAITLPISSILGDNDTHYSRVKAAVTALQAKSIQLYDNKRKTWLSSPLILQASVKERSGLLHIVVPKLFYDTLFDLTNGWSAYDINIALSLHRPYSVRWYAIVNHASRPIVLTIDQLKQSFGVQDLYKQTADFIKKCVDPAAAELKDAGVTYFEYERIRENRKVVALRIFRKLQSSDAPKNISVTATELKQLLGQDIMTILINQVGFSYRELSHYNAMFEKLAKAPHALTIVSDIVHRYRKGRKTKGYIIAALRDEVASLPF